jgi:hypothetical protein
MFPLRTTRGDFTLVASIILLARNDAPDTASRSFHVLIAAWYQVDIDMEDRLPGSLSDIYADIEPRHRGVDARYPPLISSNIIEHAQR